MATIQEIIERVDERKPNAFSQKAKIAWIAELDGKIAADVMLMNINDVRQFNYAYPENLSSEPLIEFPHDSIYDLWLGAKIDFENGEYTKYQNSMEQYNAHYNNFVHWFASTYEPAQGYVCSANENPPYYITAYALAVKSGFNGTLNEWLESLQGDKVELRYLEDKIQWRWIPNTGAVEGTSDVENVGLENDFQWHDLINVATIRGEIINHTLQTATGAAQSAKTSEENAKRYAESIKPPVYLITFSDTNDANSKWCNQEYSSIMTAHLAGLSVRCQYENYTLPLVQIGNAECIFGATVGTSYRCIVVHSDRAATVSTRSTVPVCLVTINDANKAVESYAERLAAYQSGYVIQCDYLGTRLPLKAVVDMDFMFSGTIDRTSYQVVVRSNGSTVINERSLASQTDIPTKVSDLEDAGDYLTEAPVTSVNGQTGAVTVPTAVKVEVWQKNDGSYDYSLNSLRIMNELSTGSTVFCQLGTHYLLSLVYATPEKCIFTGVYEGELYAVTVTSTGATVNTTPLSSGGGGADGLLFDETTGTLYLMQSGQILGNGVQLPTSGEGPTNNAVLTLANTTGWSSKTMPNDADCMISFYWSSVDGDVSTGSGTVTVKVENELQYSANIKQGANTISIMEYLRLGENRIDVTVTDFRGNSKSLLFLVSMFDPSALKSTKLVDRTLTGDYINGRVTKVGPYAFRGLTPDLLSLPNVTEVGECAFMNMVADEVDIQSLTSLEKTDWMFRRSKIGVVKLPSVTAIGAESLWDAGEVGRIVFNSLETIGVSLKGGNNIKIYDFHALTSLRSLPHHGSQYSIIIRTPMVCTLQDAPASYVLPHVSLYVPRDLVDSYKVATNWSSIADRIFAIEDYPEINGGEG